MLPFAEDGPEVRVVERLRRGKLELENVALARVHICVQVQRFWGVHELRLAYCVDPLRLSCKRVMQDIVTCAGDGEDMVVFSDTELPHINLGVLPGLASSTPFVLFDNSPSRRCGSGTAHGSSPPSTARAMTGDLSTKASPGPERKLTLRN